MKNKIIAGEFTTTGLCSRNRRKRKGISLRNLALLVAAATLIGSAVFIYIGETSPRPGYAVKVPGGIEIFP